jgi:hypothetical protein
MDARSLFLLRHDAVHGGFVEDLFAGLTDVQARQRPHGLNSVVWLVWHASRVEDAAVNRFVADRAQVFEADDWERRLGIGRRDVGPGMTTSVTTTSKSSASMRVSASRPLPAVATRYPALSRNVPRASPDGRGYWRFDLLRTSLGRRIASSRIRGESPTGRQSLGPGGVYWMPGLTPHDVRNESGRPSSGTSS